MNVVVIGGGYAGMSCLIKMRRLNPAINVHLVDSRDHHIQLTRLHQTFHCPLAEIAHPFEKLSQKFGFTFHRSEVAMDEQTLSAWQQSKCLHIQGKKLEFDYLVLATGARTRDIAAGPHAVTRESLLQSEGRELLASLFRHTAERVAQVAVVGGGATGLQFLFELHEAATIAQGRIALCMVDYENRLLSELPDSFDRYLKKRLAAVSADYLPNTRYLALEDGRILLESVRSTERFERPCDLVFLFPGVVANPRLLTTNRFGQVLDDGLPLDAIFAAGDCSLYLSSGLNTQTAQAALRKGALVAENIWRLSEDRKPRPYLHRELGYFVSLGDQDGVGWMGLRDNIVTGLPAYSVKELLEAQYQLFLRGINTYF